MFQDQIFGRRCPPPRTSTTNNSVCHGFLHIISTQNNQRKQTNASNLPQQIQETPREKGRQKNHETNVAATKRQDKTKQNYQKSKTKMAVVTTNTSPKPKPGGDSSSEYTETTQKLKGGWTSVKPTKHAKDADLIPKGSGHNEHVRKPRMVRRCKSGDASTSLGGSLDSRSSHDTRPPRSSASKRKTCKPRRAKSMNSDWTMHCFGEESKGPGMKRLSSNVGSDKTSATGAASPAVEPIGSGSFHGGKKGESKEKAQLMAEMGVPEFRSSVVRRPTTSSTTTEA